MEVWYLLSSNNADPLALYLPNNLFYSSTGYSLVYWGLDNDKSLPSQKFKWNTWQILGNSILLFS